jgi:ribosome recycling factor
MKKQFNKIHKNSMELATMVATKKWEGITEDDLNTLAEALDILNDMYETLYDEVFVEVEEEQ